MSTTKINIHGVEYTQYYDENNDFHSTEFPARVQKGDLYNTDYGGKESCPCTVKSWWFHGKQHRSGPFPAVEYFRVSDNVIVYKSYRKHDMLHRFNAPAKIWMFPSIKLYYHYNEKINL